MKLPQGHFQLGIDRGSTGSRGSIDARFFEGVLRNVI